MDKLTPQQSRVFQAICDCIDETGYPPSVRELCQRLDLKSTATVHTHLRNLERKGYIKREAQKSRAFNITQSAANEPEGIVMVPLLGMVRAGMPVLAVENIEEVIPFPKALVKSDNLFLLRVEGESMVEAGILPGDYVLVRQQDSAEDGDTVVALLGDEATIKTFYREKDRIRLQPQNSTMSPIVSRDVRILGKVVGLYRSVR